MYNPSICFEDILDNCIVAIQTQGKTVEECLTHYPAQREELEPLLRLTVRLRAARAVVAPPEFRRVAVTRMRNLIATRPRQAEQAVVEPNPLLALWQKLQAAFRLPKTLPATVMLSIVIALSLLVGGSVAYASANALPGDALYPVKTAIETVQLAVSLDEARDAELHLTFARRRLDEAAALLEKDRPEGVEQALTNYIIQLESALATIGEGSGLPAEVQMTLAGLLVENLAYHEAQLTVLLEHSPEEAQPTIELALTVSQTGRHQALRVISGEPGEPSGPPDLPEAVPSGSPEIRPLLPTGTATPTSTPTWTPTPTFMPPQTPTATPSPALPVPIPLPTRPVLTPRPRPTGWPTPWPTGIPTEWPTPSEPPTVMPTEWPTPPEPPTVMPTEWPTPPEPPTVMPTEWPTPPEPPTGMPTEWPTPPEPPTGMPTEWPTEWPTLTPWSP